MSESGSMVVEEQTNECEIPKRNAKFYFEDDPMAVFLVEDKLFKVHRYYFSSGSEVFRHMFASSTEQEGSSDLDPIRLPDVTVNEFKILLHYFYEHPPHSKSKKLDFLHAKLDLLSISHRFMFDDIFQYVVQKLEPYITMIRVTDRIVLGDRYNLRSWLLSAFKELVDREEPLNEEEAKALGFKRVSQLCAAKAAVLHVRLKNITDELSRTRDELEEAKTTRSLELLRSTPAKRRKLNSVRTSNIPAVPTPEAADENQSNEVSNAFIEQFFF